MKAANLFGLLCTIFIVFKTCYGELLDIEDNSKKCESEKERLRVADQEIKIANLVNTIMTQNVKIANLESAIMAQNAKIKNPESTMMAQNVKIANLESTLNAQNVKIANLENTIMAQNAKITNPESAMMAQNVKIANLESTIMAQNTEFEKLSKQVLERRINEITSDYRFHELIQKEIEHRKHLNESQDALVEKIKAFEINYSTNISELKGTLTAIQEQVVMSSEHREDLNKSQNVFVENMKALETNYNTSIDGLQGQIEMCFEKQSILKSDLQKIANETAELGIKLHKEQRILNLTRILKRKDCQDVLREGNFISGVYNISTVGPVYCDMDTDGGGWTVFQHRYDGSVDFYRTWADYKTGFGNLHKEFWLGNDNIHRISIQGKYKLRIQMEDFSKNKRYAEYSSFSVANEDHEYRLNIGSYSGTAGDSLLEHNNMEFSTKDKDNDRYSRSCSTHYRGAWWYTSCLYSNLNGLYKNSKTNELEYNVWNHWPNGRTNMKTTTMMMRKI